MNRLLSPVERALWLMDQGSPQNFVIIAEVTGSINETLFRKALAYVQQRHPILRSRLTVGDSPEVLPGNVPVIPLRIEVLKEDTQWIHEAETEMGIPFAWEEGPLMRVVWLMGSSRHQFIIPFCHITADATSGIHVVRNLFRVLDKLDRNDPDLPEPELFLKASSMDLLRDDVVKNAFSAPVLNSERNVLEVTRFVFSPYIGVLETRRTRIIQKVLPAINVKTLLRKCREANTSIHGVLCAALLQSIVQENKIKGESTAESCWIGCTTPVNIRHLFREPIGEDMGDYISDALHYQLIDDSASLVDAARNVKTALQQELQSGNDIRALFSIGDLLNVSKTPHEILHTMHQSLPPVVVSNLGVLDIADNFGRFTLENIHFTLSINPVAPYGFGMSVTSFRGEIVINCLYLEPQMEPEAAGELADEVIRRLKVLM